MRSFLIVSFVSLVGACASPAKEDAKGQVDESGPPSTPTQIGKSDASSKIIPVDVQSAHPYTNNLNRTYSVPLTGLPSCATEARIHFKVLRTEANYDSLHVLGTGEEFDGIHDDTWTEWFPLSAANARVRLATDGSVTRHGFEIDSIEWAGQPAGCAPVGVADCGAGTVDVAPVAGVCACPAVPSCAAIDTVTVAHHLARGFNNTTKRVEGAVATYTHPGPADGPETDTIGTIDTVKLAALVRRAAVLGVLHGAGYEHAVTPGDTFDEFTIDAGSLHVSFIAGSGSHDANVQQLINDFEALFACDTTAGALTCGSGYECQAEACAEVASCICPALYNPVCGTNTVTYGNSCEAGCADAPVAHPGECGSTGDMCGSMRGLPCLDGFKCRFDESTYEYPYPDAAGSCVEQTYCDAAVDCTGLPHVAVPGAWSCTQNQCAWQAGSAWQPTTFQFETGHPYGNNESVWYQVYLPAGTQAMRLRQNGFRTEANYDFLEVWVWKNSAWTKVRSFSGNGASAGPQLTDEFVGQYFYLKFVSDVSVTDTGFTVYPEYR